MSQSGGSTQNELIDDAPLFPYRFAPVLLASALAGYAITFNRGAYAEPAIVCLVTGLCVLAWRFGAALGHEPRAAGDPKLQLTLIWLMLFALVWTAISDPMIVIYPHRPWDVGRKTQVISLLLLVSYLPWLTGKLREPRALQWARFIAFALLVIWAGVETIRCSPTPRIDVWGVQMQGAEALAHGKNPYLNVAVHDTGPGTLFDAVPYVYPPTQVYVTLPGWLLGDVRFSMLGAILLAGTAMRFLTNRSGLPSLAKDAPSLFLFLMPKLFFVLEQSWVDPVQLMFISLGVVCAAARRWILTAIVFGIASSSKQTMFWLFPLSGFCLRFRPRHWMIMFVAAALPVMPFVIWDFRALKYANFDVLNNLPYRADALTINNWALNNLHLDIPGGVGFALAGATTAISCWRLRGVPHFALAVATAYYVFFAFNRWAFANYYFLISTLAALAAAAACSTFKRA
jgi:hypothetical protein